jgi:hypothetical protein
MNWLPKHKCGLHLMHNDHINIYMTIEENYNKDQFVSEAEWEKAIRTNNVWCLEWYPETPIGFHVICASSLEAIEQAVKEKYT